MLGGAVRSGCGCNARAAAYASRRGVTAKAVCKLCRNGDLTPSLKAPAHKAARARAPPRARFKVCTSNASAANKTESSTFRSFCDASARGATSGAANIASASCPAAVWTTRAARSANARAGAQTRLAAPAAPAAARALNFSDRPSHGADADALATANTNHAAQRAKGSGAGTTWSSKAAKAALNTPSINESDWSPVVAAQAGARARNASSAAHPSAKCAGPSECARFAMQVCARDATASVALYSSGEAGAAAANT
mmetsp:Transcript_15013/g.47323  ORF Transcript_15013/g.47323 Transcript_15013/m.47323 type:complete len:255 (+) Transcript_15013:476-1240(+)